MENVSFIFKHFNETIFQSGISTLINNKSFHDTRYKNYSLAFKNLEEAIVLTFTLSYVTEATVKAFPNTDTVDLKKLLTAQTKLI